MEAEPKYCAEVEKQLFSQLRTLEIKAYLYLIDAGMLKGDPVSWIRKDTRRKVLDRLTIGDPTLEALANDIVVVRNKIIRANMWWVYKRANAFSSTFFAVEDRVQEGVFGLIRAIHKFDLDRERRFATYARHWVDCAIRNAIYRQGDTVRGVRWDRKSALKISTSELVEEELVEHSVSQGDHIMLDWPLVQKELEILSVRDQLILKQRFGDELTLDAIGQHWGVSRERIRQVQNLSMDVIRSRLRTKNETDY